MAKCARSLHSGMETTYIDPTASYSSIPSVVVPQAHLHITCPCGKEHKIDLNNLPSSTSQRVQVKEECPYGQYYIVHSGRPKYRKIMIISEFGD
jgi:hypothetical protein